jgi:hypothetical protein
MGWAIDQWRFESDEGTVFLKIVCLLGWIVCSLVNFTHP